MSHLTLDETAVADDLHGDESRNDHTHEVATDLAYKRLGIVNIVYVGKRQDGKTGWVLVDAGLPGTAAAIKNAASARFGENARPFAIVMTHAHADHAGALEKLLRDWQVPV